MPTHVATFCQGTSMLWCAGPTRPVGWAWLIIDHHLKGSA